MTDKITRELGTFTTPFKRQEILLQDVQHESGLQMLEIRIREGRRFTIVELDAELAGQMSRQMADWAEKAGTPATDEQD